MEATARPKPESESSPPPISAGGEPGATPWYLWPNLLSLDAPLVAVAWLWLLANSLSIRLPEPAWCYGILAATIWVIYVADRLLDGLSVRDASTLTPRHRFYKNHPAPFLFLIPVAAAFAVWGVLHHAPQTLYEFGSAVAFISVFYLIQCAAARLENKLLNIVTLVAAASTVILFVYSARALPPWLQGGIIGLVFIMALRLAIEPGGSIFHALPKEIFCGFTFAVGVSLPVLVWPAAGFGNALLLGCLCSLNCIAIALYESKNDAANDPIAITRILPGVRAKYPVLVAVLAVFASFLAFRQSGTATPVFPIAVAIGSALLGALHAVSPKLNPGALRVLADLALLIPPAALFVHDRFLA